MKILNITKCLLISVVIIIILFFSFFWIITFHLAGVQSEQVIFPTNATSLKANQKIKLLSWNVQYMAGKNYVFFYDLPNNTGPDERPSSKDIAITTKEVARIIQDENPDVILLQELDDGAKRTDYEDQLENLLLLLPDEYVCHTSSFYWKAAFVPHPRIMGKVGMKLSIVSKYKIINAIRHQLPMIPANPFVRQFNLKRAVLEVRMPVGNANDFVIMNTHLDAFAQGTNTMEKQVDQVKSILDTLSSEDFSWVIGGDFNLLPPGKAYNLLPDEFKKAYKKDTEIMPLFDNYQVVPNYEQVNGLEYSKWFTHFSNDPRVEKPNKTIDYVFLSKKVQLGDHYVRQHDTLNISDHLPLVVEFYVP
jgi:endonuclease/exonuclease/phosphatase family metal-dependent hydrolase